MFFAKLHPLLVHFPLALLASGVLLEIYGTLQRDEASVTAGKFNVRLGFWFAITVAIIGALGLTGLNIKQKAVLSYHILLAGTTITAFATALLIQRFWKNQTTLYLFLLLLGFLGVLATGYWGSELVHRFGVATLHPIE